MHKNFLHNFKRETVNDEAEKRAKALKGASYNGFYSHEKYAISSNKNFQFSTSRKREGDGMLGIKTLEKK